MTARNHNPYFWTSERGSHKRCFNTLINC